MSLLGQGLSELPVVAPEEDIPRYPPFAKGLPVAALDKILATQADLIERIRTSLGFDHDEFARLVVPVIERYAAFVHLLPASEAHHHRGAGGLFRHGLEVAFWAAQSSEAVIFSVEGTPCERRNNEPRWRVACCFAGLLHDVGKPLSDVSITDNDGLITWNPYSFSLHDWATHSKIDRYFIRWRDKRHKRHEQFSLLVIDRILSAEAREFLSAPGPNILEAMLEAISGTSVNQPVTRLMLKADQESVARDLQQSRLDVDEFAYGVPVERYVFDALRRLIKTGVWKVNERGAKVWRFPQGSFIVWRQLGDLYDLIAKDKIPGIPRDPDTLADILIERGFAIPNAVKEKGDRAYYRYWEVFPDAEVAGGKIKLLMLRLDSEDLIFTSEPPAAISGEIVGDTEPVDLEVNFEGLEPEPEPESGSGPADEETDDPFGFTGTTSDQTPAAPAMSAADNGQESAPAPVSGEATGASGAAKAAMDDVFGSMEFGDVLSIVGGTPNSPDVIAEPGIEPPAAAPEAPAPAPVAEPKQAAAELNTADNPDATKLPKAQQAAPEGLAAVFGNELQFGPGAFAAQCPDSSEPQTEPVKQAPAAGEVAAELGAVESGFCPGSSAPLNVPGEQSVSAAPPKQSAQSAAVEPADACKALEQVIEEYEEAKPILEAAIQPVLKGTAPLGEVLCLLQGRAVIVYPNGVKALGEPKEVIAALFESGAIEPDPIMAGKKVREIGGIKALVLDKPLSKAIVTALKEAEKDITPIAQVLSDGQGNSASPKGRKKQTKPSRKKNKPASQVKPEKGSDPVAKKESPAPKEQKQNIAKLPRKPASTSPVARKKEEPKAAVQQVIDFESDADVGDRDIAQESGNDLDPESIKPPMMSNKRAVELLVEMMIKGEGRWLIGPVIKEGKRLVVSDKVFDRIAGEYKHLSKSKLRYAVAMVEAQESSKYCRIKDNKFYYEPVITSRDGQ